MRVESYKCDFCPALKGDSNHWWLGFAIEAAGQMSRSIELRPWNDKPDGFKHLCGRECAQKFLEQWMAA